MALPVRGQEPLPGGGDLSDTDPAAEAQAEETQGRIGRVRGQVFSSASVNPPEVRPTADTFGGATNPSRSRGFVRFDFSAAQSYDDNILQRGTEISDTFTLLSPSFTLERVGRLSTTAIEYQGSGRLHRRNPELDFFGHSFRFGQGFYGTRWSASFGHTLSYSPDLFSSVFALQLGGGRERSTQGVNPVLSTPWNKRISNRSTVELQYRGNSRSSITLSGSYQDTRFRGDQLNPYSGLDARVAFNYQVSPRSTYSFFPDVRLLKFGNGLGSVRIFGFFLGHSYQAGQRVWISLYGGPQYTQFVRSFDPRFPLALPPIVAQTGSQLFTDSRRLDVGSGVSVTYNWRRSSVGLSYNRSAGGSSGWGGASQNQTAGIFISTRLGRRWTTTLRGGFGHSRVYDLSDRTLRSGNTGIRFERSLGEAVGLFIGYQYFRQITQISGLSFTRNIFTAGLRWGTPRIRIR